MPKLNLDIFSEAPAPPAPELPKKQKTETRPSTQKVSPRFIPVGFYPDECLLLDEAVLELRKRNHLQASKSAIIRALIHLHAGELADVYLRSQKQ